MRSTIAERLQIIQKRIAYAAGRAGRSPEEITLVVVSKGFSIDRIKEAIDAGVTIFGENKVQELLPKIEAVGHGVPMPIAWHFIGHLQGNKVKYITGEVDLIHSIDSLKLAEEVNFRAGKKGIVQNILLEVNVSGEESKFGIHPDETADIVTGVSKLSNVALKGLMTIAPYSENPEDSRPHFRKLREIRDDLKRIVWQSPLPLRERDRVRGGYLHDLSMGMSNDFETAIEEGATLVRVGSAIFGERGVHKGP
ncbi:MAG: YggS family pyridoxal phosphate-dependent enzyme [Nitrospirae bacterium]|nr:YggS family pyridoxal phosphate-dependent enzyme [Nitrospirota bacterium]